MLLVQVTLPVRGICFAHIRPQMEGADVPQFLRHVPEILVQVSAPTTAPTIASLIMLNKNPTA